MQLMKTELVYVDETYYTVLDAAKRLHVSVSTMRRLADDGEVPCMKTISGVRFFRGSDIERIREDKRKMYE